MNRAIAELGLPPLDDANPMCLKPKSAVGSKKSTETERNTQSLATKARAKVKRQVGALNAQE